jgi:formylglycine-generating enzyme required for sulfatase activity
MHGNVFEWCQDWRDDCGPQQEVINPIGPESGSDRVNRGGCWFSQASCCRSAIRYGDDPSARDNDLGFRLLLSPSEGPPEARY